MSTLKIFIVSATIPTFLGAMLFASLVWYNTRMHLFVEAAPSPEEIARAVPSEKLIHADCIFCKPLSEIEPTGPRSDGPFLVMPE